MERGGCSSVNEMDALEKKMHSKEGDSADNSIGMKLKVNAGCQQKFSKKSSLFQGF